MSHLMRRFTDAIVQLGASCEHTDSGTMVHIAAWQGGQVSPEVRFHLTERSLSLLAQLDEEDVEQLWPGTDLAGAQVNIALVHLDVAMRQWGLAGRGLDLLDGAFVPADQRPASISPSPEFRTGNHWSSSGSDPHTYPNIHS
jgi:hypothetical protein